MSNDRNLSTHEQPITTPPPTTLHVSQYAPKMDIGPLEEFAVEFVLTLAGMQENDPDVEPLDPKQLVISTYAAVAAYARTRPDHDTNTDITSVLQVAVSAYAQAIYTAASELIDSVNDDDPAVQGVIDDYLEGATLGDDSDEDVDQ